MSGHGDIVSGLSFQPQTSVAAVDRSQDRTGPAGHSELLLAFNLFRRRFAADIVCAVPEDRRVPGFIRGDDWYFAGKIEPRGRRIPGFDLSAARESSARLGFYLFQTWGDIVSDETRWQNVPPVQAMQTMTGYNGL